VSGVQNYLDRERPVIHHDNGESMSTDDTYADYAAQPGVNWSRLKLARTSALHYKATPPRPDTASLGMLRAVHAIVLEPEFFERDYAVYMGKTRRGKAWDEFKDEHAGKTILNEREHRQACDTAAGVLAYRPGAALLASSDTYTELGLQWTDLRSGLQCKGRADLVHMPEDTREAWVVDLKTVQSCDPRTMARDAARMGYHGQLEHYAAGVEAVTGRTVTRVGLLCVEGAAPHDCALLWLDDEAREAGRALRDRLLQTVADGEHRNVWPGQVPEPVSISLPAWAVDEAHDFDDDFTGGE
jgi:hypothetical protein